MKKIVKPVKEVSFGTLINNGGHELLFIAQWDFFYLCIFPAYLKPMNQLTYFDFYIKPLDVRDQIQVVTHTNYVLSADKIHQMLETNFSYVLYLLANQNPNLIKFIEWNIANYDSTSIATLCLNSGEKIISKNTTFKSTYERDAFYSVEKSKFYGDDEDAA